MGPGNQGPGTHVKNVLLVRCVLIGLMFQLLDPSFIPELGLPRGFLLHFLGLVTSPCPAAFPQF